MIQNLIGAEVPFTRFEGAESYGPDSGGHWTSAGQRLVTDRLLKLFAEQGIVSPKPPQAQTN